MGAEPDEIQHEIDERRERLGPRVQELRGRLQEDVKEAQAVAKERVSQVRSLTDKTAAILGGIFLAGLAIGVFIEGRRKNRERDKLLQESVRTWPWRSAWMGRYSPPAK